MIDKVLAVLQHEAEEEGVAIHAVRASVSFVLIKV
jgi:hypothetical protein